MGGRGGNATSANWMQGFFRNARRNAPPGDEKGNVEAAREVYQRLTKAKSEDKVDPRNGWDLGHEYILKEWTKDSDVALYSEKSNRLTISPGKMSTARREFERYAKKKFKQYYKRGTAVKKK